jgi:hypothetical protein
MHTMLILVALALGPEPQIVVDSVDLLETNHFFDEKGQPVFTQRIFWEMDREGVLRVRDWRLVKPEQGHYPIGKTFTWHDGNCLRRVYAASVIETWTQYDPELIDREPWPKERRRALTVSLPRTAQITNSTDRQSR